MNILYYVTSHGYGHGVRTCSIADALPESCNIFFRTTLPEHFFHEELKRSFTYLSGEFDCGCLQSDGVTTDENSTLVHYKKIAERNNTLINSEIKLCNDLKIDLIVSDITPFAFEVAKKCNIRSIGISNFTWYDIYQEYVENKPEYAPMIDYIRDQYAMADCLIALSPALPMTYFKKVISVPVVGRQGNNVRDKIISKFNIDRNKKIGLIYVGNFGMHTALWKKLELFTDWEFLGVYPLPGNPNNYHLISKEHFRYQDLIASSDAMFSKLGYGSVSESMLNGKPIVYLPRTKFVEYPVLENAVHNWGGGIKIETNDFYNLNWKSSLDKITTLHIEKVISTGIEKVVEILTSRNF